METRAEYKLRWQQNNPDRVKSYNFKYKYGITLEDKEQMALSQDNQCLICGADRPLVVDHDHKTGLVRGLLCGRCNSAIGWFELFANKATEYLALSSRQSG